VDRDPVRSCLVCRRRAPQRTLVRLALVAGVLSIDPGARLGGRGAYVCSHGSCIDDALGNDARRARRALRADACSAVVDVQAIRENWQAAHEGREQTSAAIAATGVCE